jgi:hypothetical protein
LEHKGDGVSTWGTKVATSAGKFFGWRNRIYGRDNEHSTVYMTRFWIGRLRLHVFWRGDYDPDWHDHPWGFWTFPLNSYVEEVVSASAKAMVAMGHTEWIFDGRRAEISDHIFQRVVPAFRLHYRSADHTHRVLGKYDGTVRDDLGFTHRVSARKAADLVKSPRFKADYEIIGKITTIVWRGKDERKWGFLKNRDGRWCWVHWKEYVFRGGKDAPCGD